MGDNEVIRLERRLDTIERTRVEDQVNHEERIQRFIRAEIASFRSLMLWVVGLALTVMMAFTGWLAVDHLGVKDDAGTHHNALRIIIGKMASEPEAGWVIDDLNSEFNPTRGASN